MKLLINSLNNNYIIAISNEKNNTRDIILIERHNTNNIIKDTVVNKYIINKNDYTITLTDLKTKGWVDAYIPSINLTVNNNIIKTLTINDIDM